MLVSKSKYNNDLGYYRRLCDAYRDALDEANASNAKMAEELRKTTVDLLVAQSENDKLSKQIDLLRGCPND